jgi:hypothetical protein
MQREPPIINATIPHRIELNLREVSQLLHTINHSPFQERDLDHDAEEFILSWVRECPANDPVVVHLSEFAPGQDPQPMVEGAVHNYFAYRVRLNQLEFGRLMQEGRQNLVIGLMFLLGFLALSNALIGHATGAFLSVTRESLSIAGCLWRSGNVWHSRAVALIHGVRPEERRGQCVMQCSRDYDLANCTIGKHA